MRQEQNLWNKVLIEPFNCLIQYFIDIDNYAHAIKDLNQRNHRRLLFYLMFPLFLLTYILVIPIYSPIQNVAMYPYPWWSLLLVALGCVSGIMIGGVWEVVTGAPIYIIVGLWSGWWLGLWCGIDPHYWFEIIIVAIAGLVLGTVVVQNVQQKTSKDIRYMNMYPSSVIQRGINSNNTNYLEFIGACAFYIFGISCQETQRIFASHRKIAARIGLYCFSTISGSLVLGLLVSLVPPSINYQFSYIYNSFTAYAWATCVGSITGLLAGLILCNYGCKMLAMSVGVSCGIVISPLVTSIDLNTPETLLNILPGLVALITWSLAVYAVFLIFKRNIPTFQFKLAPFYLLLGIVLGGFAGYGSITFWVILTFLSCFYFARFLVPLHILSKASLNTVLKTSSGVSYKPMEREERAEYEGNVSPIFKNFYSVKKYVMGLISVEQEEEQGDFFDFLYQSSLYWDHWTTFLPAPSLEKVIRRATLENIELAAELVEHIRATRPIDFFVALKILQQAQLTEVLVSLIEDLLLQETLRDIAQASQNVPDFELEFFTQFPWEIQIIFEQLYNASLDAEQYRQSLGWSARHVALSKMIEDLDAIGTFRKSRSSNYASAHKSEQLYHDYNNNRFVYRIKKVISHWRSTAQHVLAELNQEAQTRDHIVNPYVVGQALQPGTKLFVGRRDLARRLEQGLSMGIHRPTLFLNGERRMGKSSTIRQLPHLLPPDLFSAIFFDLQAPEMSSSIAAFLGTVAEKIYEEFQRLAIDQEAISQQSLHDANVRSESTVYYVFNEWLKQIEQQLEMHNRILLLSFDEFEQLENVAQTKNLDLSLLLGWFRSVIQNHPRLALLFSGGKAVSEMGQETHLNWSGYFVNVQTFRVSFLQENEARELITQPLADYPIEQIFGDGVVDEIIRVTGCHPFLVQAVCSNLVNNLNADDRNCTDIQDVTVAVKQVIEDWEDSYFHDLWLRTDQEQRRCLAILNKLEKANMREMMHYSNSHEGIALSSEQTVRSTIQTLLKRDLVTCENEQYKIATPIFRRWVERNC